MAETQEYIATGRRKRRSRDCMTPGNGKRHQRKSFEDFPTVPLQNTVLQPLQVVAQQRLRHLVNTTGGGATGQAGAAARDLALLQVDANLRGTLKAEDC
jgi:ribosomal protein S9